MTPSEYRGQHQPRPDGYAMHEASEAYPDVYEHPEYYRQGDTGYDDSLRVIRRTRGLPDAPVTIYRAVPHGVTTINPGDWVTTSKAYARQHGMHATDPKLDWPVISITGRARDLRTDGDDVNEWGYYPERTL